MFLVGFPYIQHTYFEPNFATTATLASSFYPHSIPYIPNIPILFPWYPHILPPFLSLFRAWKTSLRIAVISGAHIPSTSGPGGPGLMSLLLGIGFTSPKNISGDQISPRVGWCLTGTFTTEVWNRDTPSNHPFSWHFPRQTSPFFGVPPEWLWKLPYKNHIRPIVLSIYIYIYYPIYSPPGFPSISPRLGKAVLKNLLLGIIAAEFRIARDRMKQARCGGAPEMLPKDGAVAEIWYMVNS